MSGNLELKINDEKAIYLNPAIATPILTQLPRKTFLQKAREDLLKCQEDVNGKYRRYKKSRCAMVKLLSDTIIAAQERNYDDGLYTTYSNIAVLIENWYFEDTLKNIINTTLLEVQGEVLERQAFPCHQVLARNQELTRAFEALERANRMLEQTAEEKSAQLTSTQAKLNTSQAENNKLQEELAKEKAENIRLKEELAKAKGLPKVRVQAPLIGPTQAPQATHLSENKWVKEKSKSSSSLDAIKQTSTRFFTGSPCTAFIQLGGS